MKILGYTLAILGWLVAAVIFRYGLYPPQLLFWLVLMFTVFVVSGLGHDRRAGLKLTGLVWVLVPIVYSIYPNNNLNIRNVLISLAASLLMAFFIGSLAARFRLKNILKGLTLLAVVFSVLLGTLYYQIEKSGQSIPLEKADAAIILGAAVWEGGKPSPSMAARVRKGVELYQAHLVDKIIVSGGLGRIPPTEAEVMGSLANDWGVPPENILLEDKAKTTEENILFSKNIGDGLGFNSYVIVSDAFHLKRVLLIANDLGISAQGAPALDSPLYTNGWLRFKYTLRETFGLVKYYLSVVIKKFVI
ncbi:MAG: YdcF family protein [Clostridia bacterium]|nr:YdcF family protein [Clostridia bacterium]